MWKPLARVDVLALWLCAVLFASPASAGDVGESLNFNGATQLSLEAAPDSNGGIVYESGPSAAQDSDSDTVLFHGEVDGPVEFEVSRQAPDGTCGPWTSAYLMRYPDGRFWG